MCSPALFFSTWLPLCFVILSVCNSVYTNLCLQSFFLLYKFYDLSIVCLIFFLCPFFSLLGLFIFSLSLPVFFYSHYFILSLPSPAQYSQLSLSFIFSHSLSYYLFLSFSFFFLFKQNKKALLSF